MAAIAAGEFNALRAPPRPGILGHDGAFAEFLALPW